MRKPVLGLFVILPVLSCTVNYSGDGDGPGALRFKEFEKSIDERFDVVSDCRLGVFVDDSELEIIGWDKREVSLEGVITISAPSEEKAEEVFDTFALAGKRDEVTMQIDAGSIRVRRGMLGCSSVQTCHALIRCTIHVPYRSEIGLELDDGRVDLASIKGNIHVDGDDLSMNMRDIESDRIRLHIDDGRIDGATISGRLKIQIDDGHIELRQSTISGMEISLDDGSVDIETPTATGGRYEISADDADITMRIQENAGIDMKITKDDGSFESDFPLKGKHEENLIRGTIAGGGTDLKISTDDGDIRIMKMK